MADSFLWALTKAQAQACTIPTPSLAEAATAVKKSSITFLLHVFKNKNNLANLQAGYLIQNIMFQIVMQNMSQG